MQKVTLTVYIPKTLRLRVVAESNDKEKTLSDHVRDILEDHYAQLDAEEAARRLEPPDRKRKEAHR